MTLLKVTQGLAGINMLHHYHNILTDTLVQGSITQNPYLIPRVSNCPLRNSHCKSSVHAVIHKTKATGVPNVQVLHLL